MAIINNSTTILLTNAPTARIYTHMNRMYLYLEQNSECYRGQDYDTLAIVVTAYGEDQDGNLDPENALSSWSRVYQQFQINTRIEPDGFPPYNIWVGMHNHWYGVQLQFNFNSQNPDGGNISESKAHTIEIDNRQTTLTSQESSQFFTGTLRDNLQKTREFSVWFDTKPPVYTLWDLLSNDTGTIIKQITSITGSVPNQQFQLLPAEKNYLGIVQYIMEHRFTSSIIDDYFPLGMPEEAQFTFQLYLNQESYLIHFRGKLQFLLPEVTDG